MARTIYKYMAQEVGDVERAATFAARHAVLNAILSRLRGDIGKGSLNSFLISGPRGSGKTTLLHMVRQKINDDPALRTHWLPVILPEEHVSIGSLRDLLSIILEHLALAGVQEAQNWHERCERETDDEKSRDVAIRGLAAIAEQNGKKLLVGIENFDDVLRSSLNQDSDRAALRKLLLDKPFIAILASTTSLLEIVNDYHDPLWNHFERLQLRRLQDAQVDELLRAHAIYRNDTRLLSRFRKTRGIVRTLARLTGGNPRLLLMLYEVVSLREVNSAVEALLALVDEMTPLYNGLLERIPVGSRKVLDAIMRAGGTAQPSDIAKSIRGLKLSEVTSHLRRLKQDGYVIVIKGGKGRAAYYSASDQFFGTWYQMRYLRVGKKRIELFVEILRAWFAPDERLAAFQEQLSRSKSGGRETLRGVATDYLLDSMSRTPQLPRAISAIMGRGIKLLYSDDPAAAIDDFTRVIDMIDAPTAHRAWALLSRGIAYNDVARSGEAIADFTQVISMADGPSETRVLALANRGFTQRAIGNIVGSIADYTAVIEDTDSSELERARARINRGAAYEQIKDAAAAFADYSTVIEGVGTPAEGKARALVNRAALYEQAGDIAAEIADYTYVIEMADAPLEQRARALISRGISRAEGGEITAAIADYTHVVEMANLSAEQRAIALISRALAHDRLGNTSAEIADYTSAIELVGAPSKQIAWALLNRGLKHGQAGDHKAEIADYTRVIEMTDAPPEERAKALVNRGVTYGQLSDGRAETSDYSQVIEMTDAPVEQKAKALINRGVLQGQAGDISAEIADYAHALELGELPTEQRVALLFNRAIAFNRMDDTDAAIADHTRIIDMPGAPTTTLADALVGRGLSKVGLGDMAGALVDYARVIEMVDVPANSKAAAYCARGLSYELAHDRANAIADYTLAIEIPDVSTGQRILALECRAAAHIASGNVTLGLTDWTRSVPLRKSEEIPSTAIAFLKSLARPELRQQWPAMLEAVSMTLAEEAQGMLSPLRLVAERLNGAPESLIDGQPPEVREFALEVLSMFDAEGVQSANSFQA